MSDQSIVPESPFIAVNYSRATWLVTGVQLESGDIASFEHRGIADEIMHCKR